MTDTIRVKSDNYFNPVIRWVMKASMRDAAERNRNPLQCLLIRGGYIWATDGRRIHRAPVRGTPIKAEKLFKPGVYEVASVSGELVLVKVDEHFPDPTKVMGNKLVVGGYKIGEGGPPRRLGVFVSEAVRDLWRATGRIVDSTYLEPLWGGVWEVWVDKEDPAVNSVTRTLGPVEFREVGGDKRTAVIMPLNPSRRSDREP